MTDGMYVVKTWDMLEKEYGLNEFGGIDIRPDFTVDMEREMPIHRNIKVKVDIWNGWDISDDMILSEAFKPGEEIEVRDSEDERWIKYKFCGLVFGNRSYPFHTNGGVYCFGRKIPKPTIEITVKINGKESQLSDISEETLLKIRGDK